MHHGLWLRTVPCAFRVHHAFSFSWALRTITGDRSWNKLPWKQGNKQACQFLSAAARMDHGFGAFGKIVIGYEDCAGSKVLAELDVSRLISL